MKKTIFFFILAFIMATPSYAQWGIKAGTDISTFTDLKGSQYRVGFHIGGTYDFKLAEKWYLQPELLFSSSGVNLKSNSLLKDGHIEMYSLEAPIDISFRPNLSENIKLIVNLGWYVRQGLFGDQVYTYHEKEKFTRQTFKDYRRFDTGINAGIGVSVKKYVALFSFQRGAIYADKGNNYYNQKFRLSVGYNFK